MAYSELIKNFEKIRSYMREFYVYGFKSRNGYDRKSARSYDDERRRVESWLGDYMRFAKTNEGKNVFLSVDSRTACKNPFYKAWKAKSFTDGDITLHFAVFDILYTPEIKLTLSELVDEIDLLLSGDFTFDESTLRKKLKEYTAEGIIITEKQGRKVLYCRSETPEISGYGDAVDFFSEIAPCGALGNFMLDESSESIFRFKHHYITRALDSDILCELLSAVSEKRSAWITVRSSEWEVVPLKIFSSVQSGREWLMAYSPGVHEIRSYRIDFITGVRIGEIAPRFDELRGVLSGMQQNMWGVACSKRARAQRVEFLIYIGENEEHIYRRLLREKRCGTVERIDQHIARFSAELTDSAEIRSWIRTFTGRIIQLDFGDRTAENLLRDDMQKMYEIYGIGGG